MSNCIYLDINDLRHIFTFIIIKIAYYQKISKLTILVFAS